MQNIRRKPFKASLQTGQSEFWIEINLQTIHRLTLRFYNLLYNLDATTVDNWQTTAAPLHIIFSYLFKNIFLSFMFRWS